LQTAGLNCLRLLNETTATALAYGIYKTDLPEGEPVHVVFVDVGYASTQVCVVALKKGQLQVLSNAWDRDLGGRNFDQVLFNHFVKCVRGRCRPMHAVNCQGPAMQPTAARYWGILQLHCVPRPPPLPPRTPTPHTHPGQPHREFQERYKIDVRGNMRACHRLRMGCEKMKKVLTTNPEAPISVECIMNDVDVQGVIARDVFEEEARDVLGRLLNPVKKVWAWDEDYVGEGNVGGGVGGEQSGWQRSATI
jgi:hypothetical protein